MNILISEESKGPGKIIGTYVNILEGTVRFYKGILNFIWRDYTIDPNEDLSSQRGIIDYKYHSPQWICRDEHIEIKDKEVIITE